jgi:hypothetical protein
MKFFKNIDQDKSNGNKGGQSSIPNTTLEEFLELLKEKKYSEHRYAYLGNGTYINII